MGGGYTDLQIAPDAFRVRFHGNEFTDEDRSQDFALLRAAELCLENSFGYFIVGDEASSVSMDVYGSSTEGDGAVLSSETPTSSIVVRCHQEKPIDREDVVIYEAAVVAKGIRSRYGMNKE